MKQLLTILMAISLYSIQAQTWTQVGSDFTGLSSNQIGYYHTVSMPDPSTLAIGEWKNDDVGTDAGKVWVYNWNGTTWIPKGSTITGSTGDQAGPLDMPDANTIAIGSPLYSSSTSEVGQVRIYTWNGSNWQQKGASIDGAVAGDRIGYCVKMPSPNTVAIGSYYHSNYTGKVMVYDWNGSSWVQRGIDLTGAINDWFGSSVHMPDSLTLAIGSVGINSFTGKVQIYEWNGTAWVPKGNDFNGGSNLEEFGASVYMPNTNTVGIGASGFITLSGTYGTCMVYDWNGTDWIQRGDSLYGFNQFGASLSMPDDNTLAVGGAGNTRLYNWSGTTWNQVGSEISGNGFALSMPDNYTIVRGDYINANVRVFQLSGATAIEDLSSSVDLKLYPNPNTGVFVLSSAAVENEAMIELYDMKGARLLQLSTTTKETIVDTDNTPAGLYVVRLIVDGKSAERVVILR